MTMQVQTRRFGPLETVEVPASQVYEFYPGLGGFEDHHQFALIPDQDSPLEWLQSTADPDVVFALLEPFIFCPDYSFEMTDADAAALGLTRPADALVRVILTLRDSASAITANLMAPVVLNPSMRLGRQMVLQETEQSLRFPVLSGLNAVVPADAADNQDEAGAQTHAA
jgi:flagellar assembly factor FliW